MRKLIDETDAFFKAASILSVIENRFGFAMPDPKDEAEEWGKLTLGELVRIGCSSNPLATVLQMTDAIRIAVRSEFPRAPEPVDFTLPILDALSSTRKYGGY
jgi:hypothetical protein